MTEQKKRRCRRSIDFEGALMGCDLREGHEGEHWLTLVHKFDPRKPLSAQQKRFGYLFWTRTDR